MGYIHPNVFACFFPFISGWNNHWSDHFLGHPSKAFELNIHFRLWIPFPIFSMISAALGLENWRFQSLKNRFNKNTKNWEKMWVPLELSMYNPPLSCRENLLILTVTGHVRKVLLPGVHWSFAWSDWLWQLHRPHGRINGDWDFSFHLDLCYKHQPSVGKYAIHGSYGFCKNGRKSPKDRVVGAFSWPINGGDPKHLRTGMILPVGCPCKLVTR